MGIPCLMSGCNPSPLSGGSAEHVDYSQRSSNILNLPPCQEFLQIFYLKEIIRVSLFWHVCHLNPVGLVLHGVSPQPLVVEALAGGQPRGRPPPQQPRDEVLGGRGHMVELGQVETVLAPGY